MIKKIKLKKTISGIAIANAINNGITFLSILFLSKSISTNSFGHFSISVSIIMTLAFILDFGTGVSLVRNYNRSRNKANKEGYIGAVIKIRAVLLSILLLASYPLGCLVEVTLFKSSDANFWPYIFVSSMAMSLWGFWKSFLQAKQNYRLYTGLVVFFAMLRFFACVYLYAISGFCPEKFVLLIYCLPPIIVSLICFYCFANEINIISSIRSTKKHLLSRIINYAKWPFISMLLFPLITNIPLWMMGVLGRYTDAGLLGIGVIFASAISPLREALKIYFVPKVSAFRSDDEARVFIRKIFSNIFFIPLIVVPVSIFSIIIEEYMNQGKYSGTYLVIPILIFTQIMTMFTGFFGVILHYLGRPWVDSNVNIIRIIMSLLFSLLLIPGFGGVGAAVASSLSIIFGEILISIYVVKAVNYQFINTSRRIIE